MGLNKSLIREDKESRKNNPNATHAPFSCWPIFSSRRKAGGGSTAVVSAACFFCIAPRESSGQAKKIKRQPAVWSPGTIRTSSEGRGVVDLCTTGGKL